MQPEISCRQVGRDSSRLIHDSFLHLSPPAAFPSIEFSAVAKDTGIGADGLTGRTRKKAPKTAHTGQKSQTSFPSFVVPGVLQSLLFLVCMCKQSCAELGLRKVSGRARHGQSLVWPEPSTSIAEASRNW